jgi:hypothetical protein
MDNRVLDRDEWTLSFEESRCREALLSKHTLGAVLTSRSMLDAIRRELHRIDTTVSIELSEIKATLVRDVMLPDVFHGQEHEDARAVIDESFGFVAETAQSQQNRRDALQLTTSDPDSTNIAGDP